MKDFLKNIVIFILRLESKLVLITHRPKIIAITGTIGKTTTKDILYAGLKDDLDVRVSPKGFNSDIGVLLTILNLKTAGVSMKAWLLNIAKGVLAIFNKNYPKVLILEVGANYPKEIERNAKLLKPNISIFTLLPEMMAHMEFFETRQDFVNEKMFLAKYTKRNGVILFNADDKTLKEEVLKYPQQKISFGKNGKISFEDINIEYKNKYPIGISIKLNKKENVFLGGVLAEHFAYPVTASLAVAEIFGLDKTKIINSIEKNYVPAPGRMRVFQGKKDGVVVIDDSYNALPESIKKGAEIFAKLKIKGRKIYVLGRLAELGDYTEKAYEKSLEFLEGRCDVLCIVNDGDITKKYLKNYKFQEVYHFNKFGDDFFANTDDVGRFLVDYLQSGDTIIFKGARHSTAFERAICQIINQNDIKNLVQEHLDTKCIQ